MFSTQFYAHRLITWTNSVHSRGQIDIVCHQVRQLVQRAIVQPEWLPVFQLPGPLQYPSTLFNANTSLFLSRVSVRSMNNVRFGTNIALSSFGPRRRQSMSSSSKLR